MKMDRSYVSYTASNIFLTSGHVCTPFGRLLPWNKIFAKLKWMYCEIGNNYSETYLQRIPPGTQNSVCYREVFITQKLQCVKEQLGNASIMEANKDWKSLRILNSPIC